MHYWHGVASDFEWIAEYNTLHLMDAQAMVTLGQVAMAHKQAMIFAAHILKDITGIAVDYQDHRW